MRFASNLLVASLLGLFSVGFLFAAEALAARIAGGELQSCAISAAGAVSCWGQRSTGSLGDGQIKGSSYVPVPVVGIRSKATDVAGTTTGNGGSQYACAIVAGSVKCWGTGGYGTLGDGRKTSSAVPVQVTGLTSGVTSISLNATHACAVQSGNVWCWGSGYLGGAAKTSPVPVQVMGLAAGGATAVAVGWRHACALVAGTVSCWVGKGAEPVPGLAGVTSIAAGLDYTCAVVGGAVSCWGRSAVAASSKTPRIVPGLESGVTAIAGNWQHACAIKAGVAWCWGINSSGQIGNGAKLVPGVGAPAAPVPVEVKGPKGVTSIAVGKSHSCAIAAGGVRWCWGSNGGGQLGRPATVSKSSVAGRVTAPKR